MDKQTEIPCLYLHSWLEAKLIREIQSKATYAPHGLILLGSFQCIIFSNNSFLKENKKNETKWKNIYNNKKEKLQSLQAEKEKEIERAH